jgi:hypothetical protein
LVKSRRAEITEVKNSRKEAKASAWILINKPYNIKTMTNLHTQPKSDIRPITTWYMGESLLVANMVSQS